MLYCRPLHCNYLLSSLTLQLFTFVSHPAIIYYRLSRCNYFVPRCNSLISPLAMQLLTFAPTPQVFAIWGVLWAWGAGHSNRYAQQLQQTVLTLIPKAPAPCHLPFGVCFGHGMLVTQAGIRSTSTNVFNLHAKGGCAQASAIGGVFPEWRLPL